MITIEARGIKARIQNGPYRSKLLSLLLLLLFVTQLTLIGCSTPGDSKPLSSGTDIDSSANTIQDTPYINNAEDNASTTVTKTQDLMVGSYLLDAPCYSQTEIGAVMGCEGASLLDGLHTKGYALNYDLRAFLDEMPIAADQNPHHGFGGSSAFVEELYDSLGREAWNGIFPAPLAEWGKRYGNVVDISGASAEDLVAELAAGNPSVVYITTYWDGGGGLEEWWFGTTVPGQHVVLLDGYDGASGQYHICDPYFGSYWVDSDTFLYNYNLLHWAVAIR